MNILQQRLLIFAETCIVDHRGQMMRECMNDEDRLQLEAWDDEGLVTYAGLQVRFSDRAWKLAHQYRRERAERSVPTMADKAKK